MTKRFSIITVASLATLSLGGCSAKVDPKTWTCASLVQPVIDMSKSKDPRILEITGVSEIGPHDEREITCGGGAEWSDGEGSVKFGAHVSDGGEIIVEYEHT